jgi:LysM repeat protein
MPRPIRITAVLALVVAALWSATARAAPAAQDACPGNMLTNADFEGGSRKTEREGTSLSSAVSNGWSPWFVRGNESVNREPEFKVEQVRIGGDPTRVRSGGQSMKWFTTWGTHTAGMYQRVNARAGTPLTFSIYGMSYTGQADGWDDAARMFKSDPVAPGNYRMQVGIDPTGAVPQMGSAPPASVVWSAPVMTYDQWVPMSVSAVPTGNAVTVYAKGQPEWSVKHNDSFWEDACLRVGAAAPAVAAASVPPQAAAAPAPAPATGSSASTSCRLRHTVRSGDTVSAVAAANGSTIAAIAQASNLANPSRIHPGQVLCIP